MHIDGEADMTIDRTFLAFASTVVLASVLLIIVLCPAKCQQYETHAEPLANLRGGNHAQHNCWAGRRYGNSGGRIGG